MNKEELMLRVENERLKAEIEQLREDMSSNSLQTQQEYVKNRKFKPAEKKISNVTIAELFSAGVTPYKIGKMVGMSQQGVINRLQKMNLWETKEKGNQYKKLQE